MPKLTLNRVFITSILGLLVGLALIFWLVFHGLQNALLGIATQSRDKNAAIVAQSVTNYLDQAPAAVENFESLLSVGIINPADVRSLRNGLLSVLLANSEISEATFTFARSNGFSKDGANLVDPATVGQVSLFRSETGPAIVDRTTSWRDGRYISTHIHLTHDGVESQVEPPAQVPDPAQAFTFSTPASRNFIGHLLWSDLHWFEPDADRPEDKRRVDLSVMKSINSASGQFAGVLRIGLFKDAIDNAINDTPVGVEAIAHTIFLCDNEGRLIACPGASGNIVSAGDLRVSPAGAPSQVRFALRRPVLRGVDADHGTAADQFIVSGTTYLCSFRSLPETQQWIVGILVPRRAYLEGLLTIRRNVIWGSLFLIVAIGLLGLIVLRAVSVAHAVILREAALMNDFILNPSQNACRFHDINRVLASLERAKTAMRSMGKYVPMELVRRLYHRDEEPSLGAESTELSVLFTDIESFTSFAEKTEPDAVATRLGAYLEVLASVIQREKGTIDKFIGDSVMAFWNAPEPVPGHAALACRAALAGRSALALLYQSPAWAGTPGFQTRFGLHHCTASVGHFGSPERFNYTAIGDGINLASRLQTINKHYGTSIIASADLKANAGPGFLFRHLDRVAVKGKTQSIEIYELIGESVDPIPSYITIYEQALDAWLARDFVKALALAESNPQDPPSVLLAVRCRAYIEEPPGEPWDGVYVFESK